MSTWIYFLNPPRDNFAATITAEEAAIMSEHGKYLRELLAEGKLILAGPTLGPGVNQGIAIFEADDAEEAAAILANDPSIRAGLHQGEVRPMVMSIVCSELTPRGQHQ